MEESFHGNMTGCVRWKTSGKFSSVLNPSATFCLPCPRSPKGWVSFTVDYRDLIRPFVIRPGMRKIRGDFRDFGSNISQTEKIFEPVARRRNCFQLRRWMRVKRHDLCTAP